MFIKQVTVGNDPGCILVQPTARHEASALPEEMALLSSLTNSSFIICYVHVDDWTEDLIPWPDSKITKDAGAGKRAAGTLNHILDIVLPALPDLPVIIGGYSLAGLFALWASTLSSRFDAVAAASPSLWISGWDTYAQSHTTLSRYVYLSLGDREEISKNQAIARIGNRVREQHELLLEQLGDGACTLVMEQGGHFTDNARRLARAFAWAIGKLSNNCETTK